MPPRAKVLPERMQKGYRNSQMLKYGFLKVGGEATTIAGVAGACSAPTTWAQPPTPAITPRFAPSTGARAVLPLPA